MGKEIILNAMKVGDTTNSNFFGIDDTGTKYLSGTASVWEDINLDPTMLTGTGTLPSRILLGTSTIPVAGFAATGVDEVGATVEYPHRGRLNEVGQTDVKIYFHMHYYPTSTNTGNAIFRLEYLMTQTGVTMPASTTISVTIPMSGTTWLPAVIEFPAIDAPDSLGQQIHFRFYRDGSNVADTHTSNVAVSTIGFHFEIDSDGSKEKLVKF